MRGDASNRGGGGFSRSVLLAAHTRSPCSPVKGPHFQQLSRRPDGKFNNPLSPGGYRLLVDGRPPKTLQTDLQVQDWTALLQLKAGRAFHEPRPTVVRGRGGDIRARCAAAGHSIRVMKLS